MPTPVFAFRLPTPDRVNLDEMARVYGAKSSGAFLAEMVGSLCSGEQERVSAFVGRLMAKMGEQMTLMLEAHVKREAAKGRRLGRRKGGRRARST